MKILGGFSYFKSLIDFLGEGSEYIGADLALNININNGGADFEVFVLHAINNLTFKRWQKTPKYIH